VIVGLTGGIASGKSTVTQMLRDLGAYVVDADVWARKVVAVGSEGLAEITRAFGADVLNADGSLNREKLGAIVFHDEAARTQLNAITHPRVRQGMREETTAFLRDRPSEPIVWDVPLLFEGETQNYVQKTVLVYVSQETQLQRLMLRDAMDATDANARIHAQMPIAEKRGMADYVIDNSGSIEQTRGQVQHVWAILRAESRNQSASLS
jgi:dephospho-CoA kinase